MTYPRPGACVGIGLVLLAVLVRPAHSGAAASVSPVALTLSYAAYLRGFRAMVVAVDLREEGDAYSVALHDHTVGLVGAMIDNHVASEATGRLDGDAARPARYRSSGHSRGADRMTEIDDEGGAPVVRVLSPVEPNRDKVPPSETVGTVDPLSAMAALFREIAATGRCEGRFRIFDGARLTSLQSWTVGPVTAPESDASPYGGPATACDFRTEEVGGFLHDANYERSHAPQGGRVWLAPAGPGGVLVPIRARFSTVEHGEVALFLTSTGTSPADR